MIGLLLLAASYWLVNSQAAPASSLSTAQNNGSVTVNPLRIQSLIRIPGQASGVQQATTAHPTYIAGGTGRLVL